MRWSGYRIEMEGVHEKVGMGWSWYRMKCGTKLVKDEMTLGWSG